MNNTMKVKTMNQKTNEGGTPKSIDETILNAMCIGIASTFPERMKQGFRDYLAQKFCVALMKCHTPEQKAIVEDLWFAVTGERLNK